MSESPPLSPSLPSRPHPQAPPTWACVPLNEICFGPSATPTLPPLGPSPTHCVTFKTDDTHFPRLAPPTPTPPTYRDLWDEAHVRMPSSSDCLYPVADSKLERKWKLITESLSKPIRNSVELEAAILSYNTRFHGKWKFHLLHTYFTKFLRKDETENFFGSVLPRLTQLTLKLPSIMTHAVPLLRKGQPYSLTLSQEQIACLLANAFFCTYPRRNSNAPSSEFSSYPSINFNTLLSSRSLKKQLNKLKCIFHYFERVLSSSSPPTGAVTFTRQVLKDPPNWDQCMKPFTAMHITSSGCIEDDGHGMLQVDFANKYVGGGVLSYGCVQEEIRFLICPELIVSRLFTEELSSNESLLIVGAEQYSTYRGYSESFEWGGDFKDHTLADEWGRRQVRVVAIDALIFGGRWKWRQYERGRMERELVKAYSGFSGETGSTPSGRMMAVATGNWGCGAFGGDPQLKAMLQWMACSVAQRDMVYFTFDKGGKLMSELATSHELIKANNLLVSDLWRLLNDYYTDVIKERGKTSLFQFMCNKLSTSSK